MSSGLSFGKYQLYDKVGEGGMAIVWRAKLHGPNGFEKSLVVKQIRPELAARPEFVELFVAEAKLTVSLSHASIAQVFELGMVDGVYFLALELVDGPPLAALIKGGPVQPFVAAYIVEQVLRGLDYAHRRGVVHRDLSAANVLVSREGEVKIVDFGIAAAVDARAIKGGSAGYMAPEQEAGGRADARSDLYAVGVLLWELLAGQRYDGTTPRAPLALQALIARATAREPSERFADAATMLAALTRFLRDVSYAPNPVELSALIRHRGLEPRSNAAADDDHGDNGDGDDEDRGPRTRPIPRTSDERGSQVTFATRVPELEAAAPASHASSSPSSSQWPSRLGLLASLLVSVAALGLGGWQLYRRFGATPPAPELSPRVAVGPPQPPPSVAPAVSATPRLTTRGRLAVRSDPPGADVLLGTKLVGQTPCEADVAIDRPFSVHLRKSGFAPIDRVVGKRDFVDNTATVRETLAPLVPGYLTLNALPWAHVSLDGAPWGDTPIAKKPVPPGVHTVRFTSPATGHDFTLSLTVTADAEQKRLVDLRGEPRVVD